MRRRKQALLAFVAAVITELLLFLVFAFQPGGNAQGIWIPSTAEQVYMCIHLLGWIVDSSLGVDYIVSCVVTGILQFFVIYWLAVVVWGKIEGRVVKRHGR